MTKIIKEPVYRKIMVCENCGERFRTDVKYPQYSAGICECWVCKKEGCHKCASWMSPKGKKYHYHIKCKKGLPKDVLKEMQKQNDEYDRQQRWSEYVNRR